MLAHDCTKLVNQNLVYRSTKVDKVQQALKDLVEANGLPYVANLLGETTTRNIQNWIKPEKTIPASKAGMIEKILRLEGHLN